MAQFSSVDRRRSDYLGLLPKRLTSRGCATPQVFIFGKGSGFISVLETNTSRPAPSRRPAVLRGIDECLILAISIKT